MPLKTEKRRKVINPKLNNLAADIELEQNQPMKNFTRKGIFSVSDKKIQTIPQDNSKNLQELTINFRNNIMLL